MARPMSQESVKVKQLVMECKMTAHAIASVCGVPITRVQNIASDLKITLPRQKYYRPSAQEREEELECSNYTMAVKRDRSPKRRVIRCCYANNFYDKEYWDLTDAINESM